MTTSLEADELAVGMITREMCKGQDSWSSTPDQRRASALPGTAGRSIGLLWAGGGSKKKEGAPRPGAAAPQVFNGLLYYRMLQVAAWAGPPTTECPSPLPLAKSWKWAYLRGKALEGSRAP